MDKNKEIQKLKDQLLQANFDLIRAGKEQEKWEIREEQLEEEIKQLRAENNKTDYDLGDPKYSHLLGK